MHYFKDTNGQTWTIEVNVLTIKKVRAHCNVNLLEVLDFNQSQESDLLARIAEDPVLLADILYAICVPDEAKDEQAEKTFLTAINGQVIEQATMALLEEIADFFPKAKGALLRKVLELAKAQEKEATATLEKILTDQSLQREISEAMTNSSSLSTKSLASSASTPTDTPSGN